MHFVYNTEKIDQLKYYSSLEYWRDDFVLYPSLHWFFRNNVRYALKYQPDRQILVLASMVTSPKLAYHSDFQGLESKWANTLIIEWSTLEGPSLHWWPMALSRCHFGLCKLWVVCVHHTRQPPDHEDRAYSCPEHLWWQKSRQATSISLANGVRPLRTKFVSLIVCFLEVLRSVLRLLIM